VELIFHSRTYKTVIKKYATIYSNDPVTPRKKIHLEIEVDAKPDTTLGFTMSDFAVSFTENRKKATIEIVSTSSENIILNQLNEPMDGLKVDVKNHKIKPGKKTKLKFEWKNDIGKENIEESITFKTNDSTFFSIPVFIVGTDPTPTKAELRKVAAEKKRKEALEKSASGNNENTAQKPGTVKSVKPNGQTQRKIPTITKSETTPGKTVTKQIPTGTKPEPTQQQKDDSGQ